MPPEIVNEDVRKETETALTVIDAARAVVIVTPEDYSAAGSILKEIKDRIKFLTDTRMSQTRPLDEAKKRIIDFFAAPLAKLEQAKTGLSGLMVAWADEQERKRREEEARLAAEAKKRAEEEALAAAIEEEQNGNVSEAEKIMAEPVYVPPVRVVSQVPTSKTNHIRETWSAEVFDLKALVEGIAAGKAPLQAVTPDMTFLNSQARSYKDAMKIPGTRAVARRVQI